MSLIEKAARRLEELKRAGVESPRTAPGAGPGRPTGTSHLRELPTAGDVVQRLTESTLRSLENAERASPRESPFLTPGPSRQSKSVELDLGRLASGGYLAPDTPRTTLADEFRQIKRPLLANAKGRSAAPVRRGNLIMVTSSVAGEGKTFTAVNLAMSIAMEVDSTVLLVDADVARPAILERLALPQAPGLLDVLTFELELPDVLLKTNVERFSILPAGTQHRRATELLASQAMNRLLDDLASRYSDRIVVFDSPPLLVSTESRALATQVGQVVLVVEADRTSQNAVKQALALLEPCPVVMTVLNKADGSEGGEYYGSYGSYAKGGE